MQKSEHRERDLRRSIGRSKHGRVASDASASPPNDIRARRKRFLQAMQERQRGARKRSTADPCDLRGHGAGLRATRPRSSLLSQRQSTPRRSGAPSIARPPRAEVLMGELNPHCMVALVGALQEGRARCGSPSAKPFNLASGERITDRRTMPPRSRSQDLLPDLRPSHADNLRLAGRARCRLRSKSLSSQIGDQSECEIKAKARTVLLRSIALGQRWLDQDLGGATPDPDRPSRALHEAPHRQRHPPGVPRARSQTAMSKRTHVLQSRRASKRATRDAADSGLLCTQERPQNCRRRGQAAAKKPSV